MLFKGREIEKACAAFGFVRLGSLSSSGPDSRAQGRRIGLPVIPSPRAGGMKRFAGTVGRDQSEGATSPVSGVMTCTIRADRELCAHAARGERCRARTW